MNSGSAYDVYSSRSAKQAAAELEQMRKWCAELRKDPEKVREFMIKGGFITKTGKLTKRYGG